MDGKKKRKYKKEVKRDMLHEDEPEDGEASGRDNSVSQEGEDVAIFECGGVPVRGDVKLDFERQGARIFGFWFNTFFIQDLHLVIFKGGLDKGHKDKHHKLYEENFNVEVVFAELTQDIPRPKLTNVPSTSSIPAFPSTSSSPLLHSVVTSTTVESTTLPESSPN